MTALPASMATKATKIRWTLMPWDALRACVRVMEFGAKKHSPRGWAALDRDEAIEYYRNACARHLDSIMEGELSDPETGEPHAAHLACSALIVCYHQLRLKNEEKA